MTSGLRHIATEPVLLSRTGTTMDKKRSPQPPRNRLRAHLSQHTNASDSDASAETCSLSADSANEQPRELAQVGGAAPASRKKTNRRRGSEWEILEGLKDGQRFDQKPQPCSGYLHKKRKWPLKGWHKRYFVLDKGILVYAKGPGDLARGKKHGSLDIGLSVISTKDKRRRIDIDAEEFIYHLKAKTAEAFVGWVAQLKAHRLHRHHTLTYGLREAGAPPAAATEAEVGGADLPLTPPEALSRDGSLPRGLQLAPGPAGGRLAAWVMESGPPLEQAHRDLAQAQQGVAQLARLLEHLDASAGLADAESVGEGASPSVKKDRKKFGLRKKKSSKGSSVDLTPALRQTRLSDAENASPQAAAPGLSPQAQALGGSSSSLAAAALAAAPAACRPQSLPPGDLLPAVCGVPGGPSGDRPSVTPDQQLREEFVTVARDAAAGLRNAAFALAAERGRLKAALEADGARSAAAGTAGLRGSLARALQQNAELRGRLARVHDVSDLSDVSSVAAPCRPLDASPSYSSSCVSASEFFDAEELPADGALGGVADGGAGDGDDRAAASDSSSEAGSLSSEEGSLSSESDLGPGCGAAAVLDAARGAPLCTTGRRTKLPVPKPHTEGLSLWNLLCKNIGKDLSQISMPVALNEPLNILQRLCEELEYSELLDKAAALDDPYERMVHIAAFAVSCYAGSSYRAGNKPFNPLLGETYESVREDRGFRFVAEQVSHHPPVSVCHAESRNFTFWQDARIKTKFWGKSMEFQPLGTVSVQLPRTGDLYRWNKITTCVHNLFGGQRWVDQYGELRIRNGRIACKLTFAKANYWSAKRHEVYGTVTDEEGRVVHKLFGKWSEALYCGTAPAARCIWRPGAMPEDYDMYYGFTRFAMELNELEPDAARCLPPTDTRWRPDQRALEEGRVAAAEELKQRLEQAQRERRKRAEAAGQPHQPRWFSRRPGDDGPEGWYYNGRYWDTRAAHGFTSLSFEPLW